MAELDLGVKLCCVGLDGGDLHFILSRRSELPNISNLIEDGFFVETEGFRPLNGCAWHSFTTAQPPSHHGLYQHLSWNPVDMKMRLIAPDWYTAPPFWKRFEEMGYRVTVVDVPYSLPGHLAKGLEVVDWGTHGQTLRTYCNQAEGQAVLRRHRGSPIGREMPVPKATVMLDKEQQKLIDSARSKTDFLIDIMNCRPWNLFIGVYAEVHRAGHLFYCSGDEPDSNHVGTRLLSVYKAIDQQLGRMRATAEAAGASFMLFSVHGMTRDKSQPGLVAQALCRINDLFLQQFDAHTRKGFRKPGIVRSLRRWVPNRVQHAIADLAPNAVRNWVVNREIAGGIDWARTPGFVLRSDIGAGDIRLNIRGREAKGFLEPGSEQEQLYKQFLVENLMSLSDAESGRPLVEEVVATGEKFGGSAGSAIPDYVVVWRDEPMARRVVSPTLGDFLLPSTAPRGGDHTVDGFAILDQKNLREGLRLPLRVSDFKYLINSVLENKTSI